MYKEHALDSSNVCKGCKHLYKRSCTGNKDDEEPFQPLPAKHRSGRPSISANIYNRHRADLLVRANGRISIENIASELDLSHGNAHTLINFLGYSTMSDRWITKR